MFKSEIPVLLCNEHKWEKITNDYSYFRKVPDDEYDDWVDLCEELDQLLESCFESDYFVIGSITNWRERAVEIGVSELSDDRLFELQKLLMERFATWRIVLQVWSALEGGKYIGNILIVSDFFAVMDGLSTYFPTSSLSHR
jgi:hypothetical protein